MGACARRARDLRWSLASLILIGLLTGSGCITPQRTIDVAALNPHDRVVIHNEGSTGVEHPVAAGSAEAEIISRWLQAHKTGWHVDFNTYAPGDLIKGYGYDLNFHRSLCVLNYTPQGGDRSIQVSRTLDESDALPELFGHR